MTNTTHLAWDDFMEETYQLLAIHSHMEAYKLAFLLNKTLRTKLYRTTDIDENIQNKTIYYPLYTYYNTYYNCDYFLVANKSMANAKTVRQNGLFSEGGNTFHTLLPEYRKVDFFLKIEDPPEHINPSEMIASIKTIQQVTTAYQIDENTIKSKENLIFT